MGPSVTFMAPGRERTIQFVETGEGIGIEKIVDTLYNPFNTPFLISPAGRAQMDGKPKMAGEIQKLGVYDNLRLPGDNNTPQIIIPVFSGNASHLFHRLDMAVQKKLE